MKKIPFHPLAFAAYPILALIATNINLLQSQKFYWALAISCLAALLLFSISWLLIRNLGKAAAITTLILILFFTYGHVYGLAAKNADPTLWLSALWVAILLGGIWRILSLPGKIQSITRVLNWVCILLLLFPLYTLGFHYFQPPKTSAPIKKNSSYHIVESDFPDENADTLPDIYYIVLDGYARADILEKIYQYDNQPLLNYLEERGFYVAEESLANYNQTILSFPTSLNMTYVQNLVDTEAVNSFDYWELVDLIHDNQVFALASKAGYKTVVFDSGFVATKINHVDHYIHTEFGKISPVTTTNSFLNWPFRLDTFETLLLENTALRPILPIIFQNASEDPKYEAHRKYITYTFSNLAAFAQEEGTYFVFAHIVAPHPPFVFDANGAPKMNWRPYCIYDGSHWIGRVGTRDDYIAGYRDQVTYINTLLVAAIEDILTYSEAPPVIIIQGDHGPGAYFDWNSMEKTNLNERMTILNAYHFPGGDQGWLYPSITPVNSFRVVCNRYLGQDFELYRDQSFFCEWKSPYNFTEVTEQLQENK